MVATEVTITEQPWIDPLEAFWSVRSRAGLAFLDSAMPGFTDSRWSYLALDPLVELLITWEGARWRRRGGDWKTAPDWRALIREYLAPERWKLPAGAPRFCGGWVGWFGYELSPEFDRIAVVRESVQDAPLASFVFFDAVDAFDLGERRRWRVVLGESAPDSFNGIAETLVVPAPSNTVGTAASTDQQQYEAWVEQARQYISAGDIYQVNLSRQFVTETPVDAPSAYLRLREASPAPYGAVLCGPAESGTALLGGSPELFLSVDASTRRVLSRPIKGTRPRGGTHEEDVALAVELSESSKDRAENVMIVDLVRNDLGRVCKPGSVTTTELCRREVHPTVFHLVSTVQGSLRDGADSLDCLAALFPGGSVTGAPKIRACGIIRELESCARGPYTGCYGYFSVSGHVHLAMTIRSIWAGQKAAVFGVGGGIVADSDPATEFEETLVKAAAMRAALSPGTSDKTTG